MKINEVLNENTLDEGPLDFVKKVGAGVKGLAQGGIRGAQIGYGVQGQANKQKDLEKTVAKKAGLKWAETAQAIKSSTGQNPTTMQAHDWLKQLMGGVEPMGAPASASPAVVDQWLQKEIAAYMAKKAGVQSAQSGAAQGAQQQQQQTQQPTQQQTQAKVDPKQYDPAEQQLVQAMDAAQRMTKEQLLQFKKQLQQAA